MKDCESCMILWVRFGERDIGMYVCMYVGSTTCIVLYVCMYVHLLLLCEMTYMIGK